MFYGFSTGLRLIALVILVYFDAAICGGLLQPVFVVVPLGMLLDSLKKLESDERAVVFVGLSCCQLCICMIVYIVAMADIRVGN